MSHFRLKDFLMAYFVILIWKCNFLMNLHVHLLIVTHLFKFHRNATLDICFVWYNKTTRKMCRTILEKKSAPKSPVFHGTARPEPINRSNDWSTTLEGGAEPGIWYQNGRNFIWPVHWRQLYVENLLSLFSKYVWHKASCQNFSSYFCFK